MAAGGVATLGLVGTVLAASRYVIAGFLNQPIGATTWEDIDGPLALLNVLTAVGFGLLALTVLGLRAAGPPQLHQGPRGRWTILGTGRRSSGRLPSPPRRCDGRSGPRGVARAPPGRTRARGASPDAGPTSVAGARAQAPAAGRHRVRCRCRRRGLRRPARHLPVGPAAGARRVPGRRRDRTVPPQRRRDAGDPLQHHALRLDRRLGDGPVGRLRDEAGRAAPHGDGGGARRSSSASVR